jgi:PadR family transcriptional regulator, regulatory protein PadR
MKMDKEILKGTVDILLLSIIRRNDSYGYEIVKELNAKSNNLYSMSEGTLYPALKRLESKGLIQSYWMDLENGGRRKYYKITDKGNEELSNKAKDWQKVDNIIRACLEGLV